MSSLGGVEDLTPVVDTTNVFCLNEKATHTSKNLFVAGAGALARVLASVLAAACDASCKVLCVLPRQTTGSPSRATSTRRCGILSRLLWAVTVPLFCHPAAAAVSCLCRYGSTAAVACSVSGDREAVRYRDHVRGRRRVVLLLSILPALVLLASPSAYFILFACVAVFVFPLFCRARGV